MGMEFYPKKSLQISDVSGLQAGLDAKVTGADTGWVTPSGILTGFSVPADSQNFGSFTWVPPFRVRSLNGVAMLAGCIMCTVSAGQIYYDNSFPFTGQMNYGSFTALAVDASNNLGIAYMQRTNGGLQLHAVTSLGGGSFTPVAIIIEHLFFA